MTFDRAAASTWLSTSEAARRLGVSSSYVRALRERGRLRSVETPLGYLLDISSIEEFARTRQARAPRSLAGSEKGGSV